MLLRTDEGRALEVPNLDFVAQKFDPDRNPALGRSRGSALMTSSGSALPSGQISRSPAPSGRPDRWVRASRTVKCSLTHGSDIANSGMYVRMGSSQSTEPRSTRMASAVVVNALDMLAIGNSISCVTGRLVPSSASPRAPCQIVSPSLETAATMPVES